MAVLTVQSATKHTHTHIHTKDAQVDQAGHAAAQDGQVHLQDDLQVTLCGAGSI